MSGIAYYIHPDSVASEDELPSWIKVPNVEYVSVNVVRVKHVRKFNYGPDLHALFICRFHGEWNHSGNFIAEVYKFSDLLIASRYVQLISN